MTVAAYLVSHGFSSLFGIRNLCSLLLLHFIARTKLLFLSVRKLDFVRVLEIVRRGSQGLSSSLLGVTL